MSWWYTHAWFRTSSSCVEPHLTLTAAKHSSSTEPRPRHQLFCCLEEIFLNILIRSHCTTGNLTFHIMLIGASTFFQKNTAANQKFCGEQQQNGAVVNGCINQWFTAAMAKPFSFKKKYILYINYENPTERRWTENCLGRMHTRGRRRHVRLLRPEVSNESRREGWRKAATNPAVRKEAEMCRLDFQKCISENDFIRFYI